ncbi:hypothetical protein CM15mP43_09300 [bacterium]|nr:MAG: hypothetical protein CM15mP43_09300 [bacterium]
MKIHFYKDLSWPVTILNELVLSLCVIGIPAYAGTAIADVTPGTISNLILFF